MARTRSGSDESVNAFDYLNDFSDDESRLDTMGDAYNKVRRVIETRRSLPDQHHHHHHFGRRVTRQADRNGNVAASSVRTTRRTSEAGGVTVSRGLTEAVPMNIMRQSSNPISQMSNFTQSKSISVTLTSPGCGYVDEQRLGEFSGSARPVHALQSDENNLSGHSGRNIQLEDIDNKLNEKREKERYQRSGSGQPRRVLENFQASEPERMKRAASLDNSDRIACAPDINRLNSMMDNLQGSSRTDYTYAVSPSYRSKDNSPNINVPHLARNGVHGFLDTSLSTIKSSSSGAGSSITSWFTSRLNNPFSSSTAEAKSADHADSNNNNNWRTETLFSTSTGGSQNRARSSMNKSSQQSSSSGSYVTAAPPNSSLRLPQSTYAFSQSSSLQPSLKSPSSSSYSSFHSANSSSSSLLRRSGAGMAWFVRHLFWLLTLGPIRSTWSHWRNKKQKQREVWTDYRRSDVDDDSNDQFVIHRHLNRNQDDQLGCDTHEDSDGVIDRTRQRGVNSRMSHESHALSSRRIGGNMAMPVYREDIFDSTPVDSRPLLLARMYGNVLTLMYWCVYPVYFVAEKLVSFSKMFLSLVSRSFSGIYNLRPSKWHQDSSGFGGLDASNTYTPPVTRARMADTGVQMSARNPPDTVTQFRNVRTASANDYISPGLRTSASDRGRTTTKSSILTTIATVLGGCFRAVTAVPNFIWSKLGGFGSGGQRKVRDDGQMESVGSGRRRATFCNGWLCCLFLFPLLLALLLPLLWSQSSDETKEYIRQSSDGFLQSTGEAYQTYLSPLPDMAGKAYQSYLVPLPALIALKMVNLSKSVKETSKDVYSTGGVYLDGAKSTVSLGASKIASLWPDVQTETKFPPTYDNSKIDALEKAFLNLEAKLNGLPDFKKCCKELDLSGFASKDDFDNVAVMSNKLQSVMERLDSNDNSIWTEKTARSQDIDVLKLQLADLKTSLAAVAADVQEDSKRVVMPLPDADSALVHLAEIEKLNSRVSSVEGTLKKISVSLDGRSEEHAVMKLKLESLEAAGMKIDSLKHLEISKQTKEHYITEALDDTHILALITSSIAKYDADKTGLADHALESSGGSVVDIRCTKTYVSETRQYGFWGFNLMKADYGPRVVIQPGVIPGECWAFEGAEGFLVIKLSGVTRITAVSYEHIPVSVAPEGDIQSAPKNFEVYGLTEHGEKEDAIWLRNATYDATGSALQYFPVESDGVPPFPYVEFRFTANHGNPKYTCLYRMRVHGKRVALVNP